MRAKEGGQEGRWRERADGERRREAGEGNEDDHDQLPRQPKEQEGEGTHTLYTMIPPATVSAFLEEAMTM